MECKSYYLKNAYLSNLLQYNGDKVVTSASDGVARVWNDKGEIKCIFKSNNMILASKWSKDG